MKRIELYLLIVVVYVIIKDHLIQSTQFTNYEEKIIERLMVDSRKLSVRPNACKMYNCNKPVNVNITYNVIQILAFSQSEETLKISGWFTIQWTDHRLVWNPADYGQISAVTLTARNIWRPDVGVMNGKSSQDFDFSTIPQSRVSVSNKGNINWLHGAILDVTCPLDVRYFPFDRQICYLILTPWQSSDTQMIIEPKQHGSTVDNSYLPNSNVSEWEIVDVQFEKKKYVSQTNFTYQFISISIKLKRQPLYFIVLVLVPFSMLSGLACLIFTLSDTGDRLTVALSLVLSMTMYVVIVSTNAPRSMRTLPVLGIYLLDQLGLLSVATVLAVVNNKIRDNHRYTELMMSVNDTKYPPGGLETSKGSHNTIPGAHNNSGMESKISTSPNPIGHDIRHINQARVDDYEGNHDYDEDEDDEDEDSWSPCEEYHHCYNHPPPPQYKQASSSTFSMLPPPSTKSHTTMNEQRCMDLIELHNPRCPRHDFVESPIKHLRKQSIIACNHAIRQTQNYLNTANTHKQTTNPHPSRVSFTNALRTGQNLIRASLALANSKTRTPISYMKLADRMDHIELTVYLILSLVNAIVCLLIMPRVANN